MLNCHVVIWYLFATQEALLHNLVPRRSPPPAFDHLQYINMERKASDARFVQYINMERKASDARFVQYINMERKASDARFVDRG